LVDRCLHLSTRREADPELVEDRDGLVRVPQKEQLRFLLLVQAGETFAQNLLVTLFQDLLRCDPVLAINDARCTTTKVEDRVTEGYLAESRRKPPAA
jgi:hypothetical protein